MNTNDINQTTFCKITNLTMTKTLKCGENYGNQFRTHTSMKEKTKHNNMVTGEDYGNQFHTHQEHIRQNITNNMVLLRSNEKKKVL